MHIYTQSYHIPGTLAADLDLRFTPPVESSLLHISAAAGNRHGSKLSLVVPSTGEVLLAPAGLGCDGKPVEIDRECFSAGQHPRLMAGEPVRLIVTCEPDAPCRDVTLVLTFYQ